MKISEVSARTGVSLDTLRYYERIGLLPPVNRSENGIRNFDELDLRRVAFIKCMRNAGLPIETLIDYFQLLQAGDDTIDARKEILVAQRDQLLERMADLQETLDLLNHKIEVYEKSLLKAERLIAEFEE
ncbi:MAG TPA: MerR family transcriptional regulator [Anaerolineales bacterium]|nr:MerR family transcriptional regulator [Anaerolineales bacterium]